MWQPRVGGGGVRVEQHLSQFSNHIRLLFILPKLSSVRNPINLSSKVYSLCFVWQEILPKCAKIAPVIGVSGILDLGSLNTTHTMPRMPLVTMPRMPLVTMPRMLRCAHSQHRDCA